MIKVAKKCTNHGMFTWRGKRNMPTYRRYINQGRIKVAKKNVSIMACLPGVDIF